MSLLAGIGAAAAGAAMALTKDATLTRGADVHDIRASRHRAKSPYRAGHTGAQYDALIRVNGTPLPVEPLQNDVLGLDGESWIVWNVEPSAAGATRMCKCMAPPAEEITPVAVTATDDGHGGETMVEGDLPVILAKVRAAKDEHALSASNDEVMSRLMILWPYDATEPELKAGGRVKVRGLAYTIKSVNLDDTNPVYRRAVVIRAE